MNKSSFPAWFAESYLACELQPCSLIDFHQVSAWKVRRGARPTYTLYVVRSGVLRCRSRGNEWLAGPGDGLILPPGMGWSEDGGAQGSGTGLIIADVLIQSGSAPNPLTRLPLPMVCRPAPGSVAFAQGVAVDLRSIQDSELSRRRREGASGLIGIRAAVVALLDALLESIFAKPDFVVTPISWPPTVQAAWNCIERSFLDSNLDLPAIATAAQISTDRLSHLCKEYFGASPWNMVTERRLAHAAKLLRDEPHLPLTQIAHRCGWKDVRWFSALYKKRFGVNPKR